MQVAGVKLLTGTDGRLFGFDVHDELAELVKAGLTPMQALQAATRNPADYFGKLDSLGTVEKGKLADFVVLDANPLDSISNANKISAVIVDGHLLDRPAVDRLQAQMKEAANPRSMRPAPSAQTTVR
jgi:imidazolonepropionase-like amidohydrolase